MLILKLIEEIHIVSHFYYMKIMILFTRDQTWIIFYNCIISVAWDLKVSLLLIELISTNENSKFCHVKHHAACMCR